LSGPFSDPLTQATPAPAPGWLRPEWSVDERVGALMSARSGGVSAAPWDSLNVGVAVGDDPAAVSQNRSRFAAAIGAAPVWLNQVHGVRVVRLSDGDPGAAAISADAGWTDRPGIACAVQVADCLPVLFAAAGGRAVAAAHAGWRGLAGGVLEATLDRVCAAVASDPAQVAIWLGPCIGPRRFEVGADVLRAFGVDAEAHREASTAGAEFRLGAARHFVFTPRVDGSWAWLADLRGLASQRLSAAGAQRITATAECTVENRSRFFSFRRDGVCGRMVAAVWIRS
jgi:YfiH family protein